MDNNNTPAPSAARVIARNTIFMMGGQIALRGGNFLFNLLVIRRLGNESFGEYSVVIAWAALFSVLGDLGITQYFTREVARDPKRSDELFWDITALRMLLAIIASVITIGGALMRGYPDSIVIGVTLYTFTYFLQALLAPLSSVIAGNERLDILSVINVVGQVVFIVAGAVVLLSGGGLIALIAVSFINIPLMIGMSLWTMRVYKIRPSRAHFNVPNWWPLIKWSLPFALIQLTLTFNFRIDTIILEQFQPFEVIGWYNAAYNLTRALLAFSSAIIVALPLRMAREHARDPNVVRPWYYRSVKFMVFFGLPLAVGGSLLSDQLVLLLFGPDYLPSAIALAILIWDIPVLMYTALSGNLTTAINRERSAMRVYLGVAIFNIVMNLLFQPMYGMIAASVVTVASDTAGVILFYLVFRREFGPGLSLYHMKRLGLSAAMMGVGILLIKGLGLPLFVTIPVSIILYFTLVMVTGALTSEERATLGNLLQRVLGKIVPSRLRAT